ncbi:MAG TPA: S24 family peptidase [Longimicrobiales bacterium]|nr:S24 family peptidase [Longimicrobiales bacterium]
MPEPLVELERRVLDYLVQYLRTNTYQPSIREIGRQFSIKSTKTVSELLQSLADKGWIERDPSRSRGVRLLGVDLEAGSVTVPWADAQGEPPMMLDRRLVAGAAALLVPAPDDALAPIGIRKDDLLLLEPVTAPELEDGDIVVAMDGGAPLLRRVVRRGGSFALETAGPVPERTVVIGGALQLRGRLVTVIRRVRPLSPQVSAPLPA